jgi:hypothetical protein
MFEQQSPSLVQPESVFAIQETQVEVVASQTRPEQQSPWDKQPSPLGTQLTHIPVVVSHLFEQQSKSLVQEPVVLQQVPLLQVWPDEQQVSVPVVVLVQTLVLAQHELPTQVVLPVHAAPPPQPHTPLLLQVLPLLQQVAPE